MKSKDYDFFKELVETAEDLVIQINRKGRLQYVSPSVEKVVGVDFHQCIGKKALLFVHKDDRHTTLKKFSDWRANNVKKANVENRIVGLTGDVYHFTWSVHLYYDEDGNWLKINTIGKVITKQKAVTHQLQRKEEMWDKLFRASPTWIVLVTLKEGAFLDFNDAFCHDTGYHKEEVIGRTSVEIGIWSDAEGRNRALSLIKEKGGLEKLPIALKMKNGEVRNFVWSNTIIEVQHQKCLINVLVDVSNLKKAEIQLAEAYKALQERSYKLSEMNTALKVLLNQRDEDRKEMETRVWYNIKNMILPHLNNLKTTQLTPSQQAHLDVVFNRLNDIASGMGQQLGYGGYGLSPREMEIASHIITGKANKDIAEILHISVHSVESHRFSIRKKLGILGSRTNLRTYLLSLSTNADDKNSNLIKRLTNDLIV